MKSRHVSKGIDVFQRTCSCLLDMKNEIPGSHYICFPIFAHILYFDEAKFSIKLVYFTVSVVRQRNENEIVTETRPIKTT